MSNSHHGTHTGSGDTTGAHRTAETTLAAALHNFTCSAAPAAGADVQPGSSGVKLNIDFTNTCTGPQTAEEERRQRRRDQNKLAAERYRNRKRESTTSLNQESERLQEANAVLQEKIRALEHHKNFLTRLWDQIMEDLQDKNMALKTRLRLLEDRREYFVHAVQSLQMSRSVLERHDPEPAGESTHHCCHGDGSNSTQQTEALCLSMKTPRVH